MMLPVQYNLQGFERMQIVENLYFRYPWTVLQHYVFVSVDDGSVYTDRNQIAFQIEGANTNLAFIVHNDGINSLVYSQLMGNIVRRSYEYKHGNHYTFISNEKANSALKKRLDMYNMNTCSRPTDNVFTDTGIDRGFLTVERKFINYDCSYVPNLCILLTTTPADNKSAVVAAAKSLRDSGVNIMAIAVGDDVDKDDVKEFASNEKYVFSTGMNMSDTDLLIGDASDLTRKIKTALMQAHALPQYTRCYEAGHIFIIIDVDKNHFETLTQLRDFVIDFDSIFVSVKTVMINSPTDDERFQDHLSSVNRSAPEVTFEIFDSNYNLSASIRRGRQVLLNLKEAYEKIIIVATNRNVEDIDDVIVESRTSQNLGVHIMALGIGDEEVENQLSQIITDPRGIDKIESFKDLKSGLRKLYRKICSSGCHSGWAHYNGMCFIYKSKSEKWLAAQKICGDLRAKLVSITTPGKYAWIKDKFLDKLKKPVHIGLQKYSLKNAPIGSKFRWENGKPLLFSDWDKLKTPPEPDGVSYEECVAWYPDGWRDVVCEFMIGAGFICEREAYNVTEQALKGVRLKAEVLPLWQEKVCPVPENGFDPKDGPILVTGNECRPLLNVHWQPREMNTFRCSNGELISEFLQCDGLSHCQDGSDEKLCSEDCTEYQFQCSNGRCVSLAYFCDYSDDCGDNSDEEMCVPPRCPSEHWQCDNGQCIPENARCDLRYDCNDKSDEGESCSGRCRVSQCDDGTCIPDHWHRDRQVDCGGGRFEDENKGSFKRYLCYKGKYKQLFYLFTRNYYDDTPNCTMVFDGFGKHFESFTRPTEDCKANDVMCPIGFYRCPSSFCIPIEKVCDGVMDCIDGEEEAGCGTYECPGYYRCPGASYCLHPSRICDGEVDCPGGKDEVMCDVKCHKGCKCSAGVVECRKIVVNITSPLDRSARKFVLTESQVLHPCILFKDQYYLRQVVLRNVGLQTLDDIFGHQMNLINLSISHNKVSEISPHALSKLKKLTTLDISYNPLTNMSTESFAGLESLRELYMRYTSIEVLDQKLFSALKRLELLDVTGSSVHTIVDEAFFGLGQLRQLYMQGNTITKFGHLVFDGLDRLKNLQTDMYSLCCPQVRPRSLAEGDCLSPKSSISSCNDLLASDILRSSVWLLCIASVVGNVVSLVIRLVWERNSMQNGFGVFVTHLGIADFFMGVYLLIIAVADTLFKGKYIWNDYEWRHSNYCKIAGTLSTLSSEASMFFICLVTLDRFLVIKFPFGLFKFRFTSASVVAIVAWIAASIIAVVPLIPSLSHWNFYIKNGACLALPFATERRPGWIYSVAIFTGLNSIAFIIIALGQYSIYRAMKKGSIVSSVGRRTQEMAVARKLVYIVVTDFLCWFPIGILSILALCGVSFGGEVYAWTAVFILPVNSALNPFLYTIPAVLQKTVARKQTTSAASTKSDVSEAQLRVRIGDPAPGQILLKDVVRQLKAKEDRVKLMMDIWEGLIKCLMTRTADQPQPNAVFLGLRGKVVDSVCLATRTDASDINWIIQLTSMMNAQPDDE